MQLSIEATVWESAFPRSPRGEAHGPSGKNVGLGLVDLLVLTSAQHQPNILWYYAAYHHYTIFSHSCASGVLGKASADLSPQDTVADFILFEGLCITAGRAEPFQVEGLMSCQARSLCFKKSPIRWLNRSTSFRSPLRKVTPSPATTNKKGKK
ncbi:hypothetical protein BR93DRAFT_724771 [Coniochaeta sp. PMI_546]|nr:hypothetical protein BR93DRAFT_724771 [Coniochaeta sp. PMI_546]